MAEERKRSHIEDINRSIYDVKDAVEYSYKTESGLTEETVSYTHLTLPTICSV